MVEILDAGFWIIQLSLSLVSSIENRESSIGAQDFLGLTKSVSLRPRGAGVERCLALSRPFAVDIYYRLYYQKSIKGE
jgi:hypothetical protein